MSGSSSDPRRILVVDDDPDFRALVREGLAGAEEFSLDEAESGHAAMRLLRCHRYHAILADWRVDALSGLDLLAIASLEQPAATRILMTGTPDAPAVQQAASDGSLDALLEKKWDADEFARDVRAAFRARSTRAK